MPEIAAACPSFVGACLVAKVVNTPLDTHLWEKIEATQTQLRQALTTETLKQQPSIAATRCIRPWAKTLRATVQHLKRSSDACYKVRISIKQTPW